MSVPRGANIAAMFARTLAGWGRKMGTPLAVQVLPLIESV